MHLAHADMPSNVHLIYQLVVRYPDIPVIISATLSFLHRVQAPDVLLPVSTLRRFDDTVSPASCKSSRLGWREVKDDWGNWRFGPAPCRCGSDGRMTLDGGCMEPDGKNAEANEEVVHLLGSMEAFGTFESVNIKLNTKI